MHKRLLTILATITLSTALLVGCGNKQEEIPQATTETATATTTEESTTEQAEEATVTSEETVEPTPEVKEEPSEETTTEPETEPTEIAEPEPTEEPTPESEPQAIYTFTDMSATMYAQQTVNVRDLPDTSGNKVGSLSTNDEITISGQCTETGWYMFEYNGSVAFVSNKYVGENKVEIQQAPADNSTASTGSAPTSNYQTGVWNDMGDYYFIIPNSEDEYWNYFNNCDDIRATLQARYPDRNTYVSSDASGSILIVSALHRNEKGFPNWSEINYIPELGMN